MSSSNEPMKPPLNATNSWVIRRARDLIGYDNYDIEQWLDNVTDDDINENNANDTGKSPVYPETSSGTDLGEPEDYDLDRRAISEKTIVETLEAVAAEMEASHHDDESYNSASFVTSAEHSCDIDEIASHSSSSLSHRYQYLPSDSLENQSLIGHCQGTNSGSTIGSGTRNADSDDSTPSRLASDTDTISGVEPESERSRRLVRLRSSSNTLSSPMSPSRSKPRSQFLTVPRPAHLTAKPRHSRPSRQGSRGYIRPHTYADAFAHRPEIERCPSPMPHVRLPAPPNPSSSTCTPLSSHPIPASMSGHISSPQSLTPSRPRLRLSRNREGETPALETVRPLPQQAGRLLVPQTPRTHFVASPFADPNGCVGHEIPALIVEEDEEEEEGERRRRSN
ncbi:hypothetical protein F4824DRAFT_508950 [Ustulina deusta]|nr:hypothetical protein F4824DRAFT_508950 [Ustulina deusta]